MFVLQCECGGGHLVAEQPAGGPGARVLDRAAREAGAHLRRPRQTGAGAGTQERRPLPRQTAPRRQRHLLRHLRLRHPQGQLGVGLGRNTQLPPPHLNTT